MSQDAYSSDGAASHRPSDDFCVAYVVDREGRTRSARGFAPARRSRHPLFMILTGAVSAAAIGAAAMTYAPSGDAVDSPLQSARVLSASAPATIVEAKLFGDERPFSNDRLDSVDTTGSLPDTGSLVAAAEPAITTTTTARTSRSETRSVAGRQDAARAKPAASRKSASGRSTAVTAPGTLAESETSETRTPGTVPAKAPVNAKYAALFDPEPAMGSRAAGLGETQPLRSEFRRERVRVAALPEPQPTVEDLLLAPAGKYERSPVLRQQSNSAPVSKPAPPAPVVAAAPVAPVAPVVQAAQVVPLPVSRPTGLLASVEAPNLPSRSSDQTSTRAVFRAALEGRNGRNAAGSALAYAGPDSDAIDASPRARLGLSSNLASALTAVYDISAQRVYLPSGRVLEAHSGKGIYKDDPRYVHLRMRGATPPGTYMLTERERPYNGVRALRMTPVGGSAAIHGRAGILAHTYMLRERGASHGCVVFADYRVFLNAYLSGEIRRIVVVPGGRGGALPAVAENGGFFGRFMGRDGG